MSGCPGPRILGSQEEGTRDEGACPAVPSLAPAAPKPGSPGMAFGPFLTGDQSL